MSSNLARSIYISLFVSTALAAPRWTNSTRRLTQRDSSSTNVDSSQFEADSSIDVSALYDYVKSNKGDDVMGTYGTCNDCDYHKDVDIYDQGSAMTGVFTFMADMDVDCDGVNYQCPGNGDGQPQTNFGEADTYEVPWYVIPDNFVSPHGVADNALGAVICDGKMFYAVFADSNGDSPQVLGEGSWLLAKSCFPNDNISGANGHTQADVAYIVFSKDTPDGVGPKTLEYGPLKTLGDQRVKQLMSKLNLGSSGGGGGGGSTSTGDSTATDTASSDPTSTDSSEPTSTGGSEPTSTDTSEPTSTDSSEPTSTATATSDPTSTDDSTATPTETSCQKEKKNKKKKGGKKSSSSKRSDQTKKSVKRTYRENYRKSGKA